MQVQDKTTAPHYLWHTDCAGGPHPDPRARRQNAGPRPRLPLPLATRPAIWRPRQRPTARPSGSSECLMLSPLSPRHDRKDLPDHAL